MKHLLFAAVALAVAASYGGFWDKVNRVQRTIETVNQVVNPPPPPPMTHRSQSYSVRACGCISGQG